MYTSSVPPTCVFAIVAYCATFALAVPTLQRQSLSDDALSHERSSGFPTDTSPLQFSPRDSEEPSPPWMIGDTTSKNPRSKRSLAALLAADKPKYKSECSRALYGSVHIDSCAATFYDDLEHYDPMMKWCNRGKDGDCKGIDRVLPKRLLSKDGKCAMDLEVRDPIEPFDYINGWEITTAVRELITACIWPSGVGGRVGKLGKNHRMTLTIHEYTPDLTCAKPAEGSKPANPNICHLQIERMPATKLPQTFGAKGMPNSISRPNIDVPLPVTYADINSKCAVTVSIEGKSVEAQWWDIWGVAIAVFAMCTNDGNDGTGSLKVGGSIIQVGISNKNGTEEVAPSPGIHLPGGDTADVADA